MSIGDLLLDCAITIVTVVGFLFNVYIGVSVLVSKQVCRPANILIIHMSIIFAVVTLFFLAFSVPTLLGSDSSHFLMGYPACVFHGSIHLIFHPLALWTVAGVHLDRFISIVNPLR